MFVERLLIERLLIKRLIIKQLLAEKLLVKQLLAERLPAKQLPAKQLLVKRLLAKRLLAKRLLAERLLVERLLVKRLLAKRLLIMGNSVSINTINNKVPEEDYELLFANKYVEICEYCDLFINQQIKTYNHYLLALLNDGYKNYDNKDYSFITKVLFTRLHYNEETPINDLRVFKFGSFICYCRKEDFGVKMNSLCYYIYKIVKKINNKSGKHYEDYEKCYINVDCSNTNKIIMNIANKKISELEQNIKECKNKLERDANAMKTVDDEISKLRDEYDDIKMQIFKIRTEGCYTNSQIFFFDLLEKEEQMAKNIKIIENENLNNLCLEKKNKLKQIEEKNKFSSNYFENEIAIKCYNEQINHLNKMIRLFLFSSNDEPMINGYNRGALSNDF